MVSPEASIESMHATPVASAVSAWQTAEAVAWDAYVSGLATYHPTAALANLSPPPLPEPRQLAPPAMEMPTAKGEADMKQLPWCIAALLFVLQASGLAQNQAKDKTELEGTWELIASSIEGFEYTEEEIKEWLVRRHVYRGNKLIALDKDGKVVFESTIKVDPKRKPATIDMRLPNLIDPKIPFVRLAIYRLEGDTLTICWQDGPAPQRPKDFSGGIGSRLRVATYKRVPEK
jgi:uncharacterized protein (TIGR03067 family)